MHGRDPIVFDVVIIEEPVTEEPEPAESAGLAPDPPTVRFGLSEESDSPSTSVGQEEVPSRAWRALIVASAGTVLVGFNSTATNIALKDLTDGFPSASKAAIGWIVAGYFIGTAALLPLGGRMADRLGRKRVFQAGLLLFALSAAASAAAPSVWLLTAARVLQSLAGAMILPSSLALVLPMFPDSRRPRAVGLWSAAGPLAASIAPSAAAAMLSVSSWRVVYFVSAPMALLLFVAGQRLLDELPRAKSAARFDILGASAGTLGVAAAVTAIMQGRFWGYTSTITIVTAAVGLVGLIAFVVSSLHHPEPMLNLRLLKRRGLWVTNASNFAVSITSMSIWLVWPLFLRNVWGYSTFLVGLGVTAGPLSAGTSTLIFSKLADRVGQARLVRVGTFIMICAAAWHMTRLRAEGNYFIDFLPGIMGFGLGWGMSSPMQNSLALEWVGEARWGETNGLFNTLRYAAAAFGTAGVFAFLDTSAGAASVPSYTRTLGFFLAATVAGWLFMLIPIGKPDLSEDSAT